MPSAARRRRTVQEEEDESEEEVQQNTQRNRRRAPQSDDDSEEEADEEDEEMPDADAESNSGDQVVKKLVRYALACEYQRLPIRRTGITEKVIGKQRGSNFRKIFQSAQDQLRTKFGMELLELPGKEKVTMKEKRAAMKTKGGTKSSGAWILTTILPPEYRSAEIMPPSIIGSADEEAAYMGICSVIVSLIALSPNEEVPEHKLMQLLGRFHSEKNMGLDTTANTLARMIRHGYVFKSIEKTPEEETVNWRIGPRGKVEIGNKGIQELVRQVYGDSAPDDLEKRIQRSLGMEVRKVSRNDEYGNEEEADAEEPENGDPGPSPARRASGRRR